MRTYPCESVALPQEYPLSFDQAMAHEGVYAQSAWPQTRLLVLKDGKTQTVMLCWERDSGRLTLCGEMGNRRFKRVEAAHICMEVRDEQP